MDQEHDATQAQDDQDLVLNLPQPAWQESALVRVPLTQEELLASGRRMADLLAEDMATAQAALDDAKRHRDRRRSIRGDLDRAADAIRTGQQEVTADCRAVYQGATVDLVHPVSNQVLRRRPSTPRDHERAEEARAIALLEARATRAAGHATEQPEA